ncbi:MAG: ankyrin repeat domain-containing protein [Pseudohongiellaceae bacterium]
MKIIKRVKLKTFAFILAVGLTHNGYAALVDMAEYQDWNGVQSNISTGDVNALQPDGMSALLWAVYYEETNIVSLLLDAGADANVQNRFGLTPLIQSSITGNSEIISLLLDAGADANARTLRGDTALMNAAKAGTLQGVQALIEAGAEVEARDSYTFQTPLMWAAGFNKADIVAFLVENGADVNARSAELIFSGVQQGGVQGDFPNGGLTSLHHAARQNAIETVETLLALGADPNILDPQGISALRVAATNENLDLAKLLIEGGTDLNDGSFVDFLEIPHKRFEFNHAARNYEDQTTVEELIALMIEMGVDVDATPEQGIPFFSTGFVGVGGTSGQTALYNAALDERLDDMELLIANGANPNVLSKRGSTPLAALLNVYDGFRPPNANNGDEMIVEPTLEEKMPMVDLLFAAGADVNVNGENGTILHQSASAGNDEVIEFLLEKGIDLSAKDSSNRTALDVASGVPPIDGEEPEFVGAPIPETPIYESIMDTLTEAMIAQGVAIEEYVAPLAVEDNSESGG